ncbi:non-canonical purine NTP pyrophosphatase [Brachybacterium huguangmaarense]
MPADARVVLATHNAKKLRELRRILAEHIEGFNPSAVVSSAEIELPDVVEDATTFAANALLKARAAATATGLIAVADDSGLAVDILGGAPGIFSARWSGRHGDDEANNDLLLAQLSDIADEHRGAEFRCAAAMAAPGPDGGLVETVEEGVMRGRLLRARRGDGGFGYDPLFVPDGQAVGGDGDHELTSAEMPPEAKDAISHRGQAFRALAPAIAALLG